MLQINLTGRTFFAFAEEALLKSVQALKTMFVVCIEVFAY